MSDRVTRQLALGISAVLVLALALSIVALALAMRQSPAAPTGIGSTGPAVGSDPEGEARRRLDALGKCQAWGDGYILQPAGNVDERIDAKGGPGNWLVEFVWIGDADSAASAWKATWAARPADDDSEVWVETTLDDRVTILGLRAFTTPRGRQTWHVATTGRVDTCP
jgi:hypothetical protein